ncbi:hypothetical protein RUM44_006154 [Polyplax serrata]|uniref:Fatty acid hydroxylase domain-containing protein n=1 Tax=Polyplax serrata TaxID=468196 RepID=A0ABR1AZ61_POLSC
MTNESLKTGEFIRSDVHEVLYDVLGGMGRLFYICGVAKTSYKHVDEVPDFYRNAWPNVLLLIALENVVLYAQHKPLLRFNDGLTSLSLGLMQELGRILFRGSETSAYIFIYNNWRLVELPWNSPVTWYIAFFLVDFFYYWGHRASHEINLFWAQHQVHHSSEEYNFPVGLRQSFFQGWCSFVFYLPMALFIPPSHFMVHKQLNLLYQVWIHTKIIKTLGPLEYVFNTPQHHRVHHACNKRYLDRNYGGVLIIWDRLFSTFASEDGSQDIVYGLVEQQPCFNPLYLQVYYNRFVAGKFSSFNEYHNKFLSLIKGPSWVPGAPWTGFEKDKLDIKPREAHDVRIPHWCNFYVLLHFTLVLMGFHYEGYTILWDVISMRR